MSTLAQEGLSGLARLTALALALTQSACTGDGLLPTPDLIRGRSRSRHHHEQPRS